MNPAQSPKVTRHFITALFCKALLALLASQAPSIALAKDGGQTLNFPDTRASAAHKPPVTERKRTRIAPPAPLSSPQPSSRAKATQARTTKVQPLKAPVLKTNAGGCLGMAMSKEQAQSQGAVCAPAGARENTRSGTSKGAAEPTMSTAALLASSAQHWEEQMREAAGRQVDLAEATDMTIGASALMAGTDVAKAGSVAAIPTLSQWGLLLLSALLGGLVLRQGRWGKQA